MARKTGYRDSVVSFVDVLGFRSLLQEKSDPNEISDIIQKVRGSLHPDDDDRLLTKGGDRKFSRPYGFSLSDAVVRIRPYDTTHRDGALFYEILDLMHAQASMVWEGILLRGAITVGKAYSHKTNDMAFGPAVVEAYEWESSRSVFPRIVVTDRAIDAYHNDPRLKGDSEISETLKLLKRGDDGSYFIDYIRGMMGEFDEFESYLELLNRHKDLIEKGLSTSQPGTTIRQKYRWLAIYHNEIINEHILGSSQRNQAEEFYSRMGFEAKPYFNRLLVRDT
ncbi:hypothetical protein AAG594_02425 [Citromicrobium bathyomarinum]